MNLFITLFGLLIVFGGTALFIVITMYSSQLSQAEFEKLWKDGYWDQADRVYFIGFDWSNIDE